MTQRFSFHSFLSLFLVFLSLGSVAQLPKRELRAAWLTTVWGLDWPKTRIPEGGGEYYIDVQKQELISILDSLQVAGLNAVFFQVRPEADAFYTSSYEPWSAHLVAQRGLDPGYDPLQFALEECHRRGLELHAWLNPYRFESVAGKYTGQEGDYRQSHPEWVLSYSEGGAILDPGNPEVRELIASIVEEIVVNYDVDGIVFDDYFYAYGGTPPSLDKFSQENWKPASMDLHDWRRENINQMIRDVYQTIQEKEPWVRFGVAPFGIWTMDPQVAAAYGLTLPPGITGMDAYKTLYANPIAWLKEGTVDYISPQLYWPTTSTGQDYKILAPWWANVANHFGRHLYVSHSLSNLDASDYPPPVALKSADSDFWHNELKGMSLLEYYSQLKRESLDITFDPSEVGQQIQWNRISDKNQAPGSVFFRASMIDIKGFINYLRSHEFAFSALPPSVPWKQKKEMPLPFNLYLNNDSLMWESSESNVRFAVYAIPDIMVGQPGLFADAAYLLGISYSTSFDLTSRTDLLSDHTFAVSILDRNGNEFPPVVMGLEPIENQPVSLVSPANDEDVYPGFLFVWDEIPSSEYYLLEVSSDSSFVSVTDRRKVTETVFHSEPFNLKEDSIYFWRVITRRANASDTASATRRFRLLPLPRPEIVYPTNELADVAVTPLIQWKPFDEGFHFRLQVATNNLFSSIIFDKDSIEDYSLELPLGTISSYSTYFLRLQAVSGDSVTSWSDVVRFSTVTIPPSVPTIVAPANYETVNEPEVVISVQEDSLAKSITFQLSGSENFPWNDRQQYSVPSPNFRLTLDNLGDGDWYVKARANYGSSSYTDWSEVTTFSLLTTGTREISENELTIDVPVFPSPDQMRLCYSLSKTSKVNIYVTSITGKKLQIAEQTSNSKGKHALTCSCPGLLPGIYLLTLETNYGRKTVKMVKSW